MSDKSIFLGGPAYNLQVSAHHASSIANLAALFAVRGWNLRVGHRHSSMLPENRDALIRDAAAQGYRYLLSMDSDCHFEKQTFASSARAVIDYAESTFLGTDIAAVVAPVRQGNGAWNVYDKSGESIKELPVAARIVPTDYAWCAFAFALFNLDWYKPWLASDEPLFLFGWDKQRRRYIGEDSYHALRTVARGGVIIVDPEIVVSHER